MGAINYPVPGADGAPGLQGVPGVNGSDQWIYKKLANDLTVSAVAAVDVADLFFTPAPNTQYEIEAKLLIQSSVRTTGAKVGIAPPTGGIDFHATRIDCPSSASSNVTINAQGVAAALNANTGAAVINVPYLALLKGLLKVGVAPVGNYRVTFASEIAASNVTIKAGSILKYRIV